MTEPKLGPCCRCGTTNGVRNLLMLQQKAPTPGQGWGCYQCHLPMDGAISVVCDNCLPEPVEFACKGASERVPVASLTGYHLHDLSRHEELHKDAKLLLAELCWFKESPDAGHPLCLCSWCGHEIAAADEFPDEDDQGIAVRMWNGRNEEARFHHACFEQVIDLGVIEIHAGGSKEESDRRTLEYARQQTDDKTEQSFIVNFESME